MHGNSITITYHPDQLRQLFAGLFESLQHSDDLHSFINQSNAQAVASFISQLLCFCPGFLTTACFCCWNRSLSHTRMPNGSPLWHLSVQSYCACLMRFQTLWSTACSMHFIRQPSCSARSSSLEACIVFTLRRLTCYHSCLISQIPDFLLFRWS